MNKMSAANRVLNGVFWLFFLFYLSGGVSWGGKLHGTYAGDATLILAVFYAVFRLGFKARFQDTTFARSVSEFFSIRSAKDLARLSWPARISGLGLIYLAALFVINPLLQFYRLGNYAFDLGIFVNTLYNAAHSHGFVSANLITGEDRLRYLPDNHLDLGLIFFVPLFKIFSSGVWILLAQSLSLLMSGFLMMKLGSLLLGDRLPAWVYGVLFWAFEPIHRMNMWDWHETSMMIPGFLAAAYFFERRKYGWSTVFLTYMALWRGDAWLAFSAFSFYGMMRSPHRFKYGLACVVGLGIFATYSLNFHSVVAFSVRYAYLPKELVDWPRAIFDQPWLLLERLWINRGFLSKLTLMAGGPLVLAAGAALIPLSIPLSICALSTSGAMLSFVAHYPGMYLGPLLFAILKSMQTLSRYRWYQGVGVGLTIALSFSQLRTSEPGAFRKMTQDLSTGDCLKALVADIPKEARVLAADPANAYLAVREWISMPSVQEHHVLDPVERNKANLAQFDYLVSSEEKDLQAGVTRNLGNNPVPAQWEVLRKDCGFYIAVNRARVR